MSQECSNVGRLAAARGIAGSTFTGSEFERYLNGLFSSYALQIRYCATVVQDVFFSAGGFCGRYTALPSAREVLRSSLGNSGVFQIGYQQVTPLGAAQSLVVIYDIGSTRRSRRRLCHQLAATAPPADAYSWCKQSAVDAYSWCKQSAGLRGGRQRFWRTAVQRREGEIRWVCISAGLGKSGFEIILHRKVAVVGLSSPIDLVDLYINWS